MAMAKSKVFSFLTRAVPSIRPMVDKSPRLQALLDHPAGPLTVHGWAPAIKWVLVIAGLVDINRPIEKVSIPQNCSLCLTGFIWARYSTVIIPVNYSLCLVNLFVGGTGAYQIFRKLTFSPPTSDPSPV